MQMTRGDERTGGILYLRWRRIVLAIIPPMNIYESVRKRYGERASSVPSLVRSDPRAADYYLFKQKRQKSHNRDKIRRVARASLPRCKKKKKKNH